MSKQKCLWLQKASNYRSLIQKSTATHIRMKQSGYLSAPNIGHVKSWVIFIWSHLHCEIKTNSVIFADLMFSKRDLQCMVIHSSLCSLKVVYSHVLVEYWFRQYCPSPCVFVKLMNVIRACDDELSLVFCVDVILHLEEIRSF